MTILPFIARVVIVPRHLFYFLARFATSALNYTWGADWRNGTNTTAYYSIHHKNLQQERGYFSYSFMVLIISKVCIVYID